MKGDLTKGGIDLTLGTTRTRTRTTTVRYDTDIWINLVASRYVVHIEVEIYTSCCFLQN